MFQSFWCTCLLVWLYHVYYRVCDKLAWYYFQEKISSFIFSSHGMKLTFCWAAKIVTGSCYMIEAGTTRFLVDCGMYQGPKEVTRLNYEPFAFDPKTIDFVLLTHAHIDHCWLIPKLFSQWFNGKVYATSATIDLVKILLEDSAEIQEKNIEDENRRRAREHLPPRKPLYTPEEADACMVLFKSVNYTEMIMINDTVSVRYQDAGHILGSASLEVFITEWNKKTKIVFSWDIWQRDVPITKDPTLIAEADYLLMESTYGDRYHEDMGDKEELLLKYVQETYAKLGKLLIPSFAVERTQELLYFFNLLINKKQFPSEKIFLDSPLAIKATEVFKKHKECYDTEALRDFANPFFDDTYLSFSSSVEDSIKLNTYDKPCVIIAGNGMCTAWRITHHLKHGLGDPKNTLLFVGYQAEWTLGRRILQWDKVVQFMGQQLPVSLEIAKIDSFSGHADADQLLRRAKWFTTLPKKTFIVHGEGEAQSVLQDALEKIGFDCTIPSLHDSVEL